MTDNELIESSTSTAEIRIPSRFKLFGQTITVKYDPALQYNEDAHGLAQYRLGEITLQPISEQIPSTQDMLEHTFFHELVHFILYFASNDEFEPSLHEREGLVDRIAGLLHQALKTAEYD